ncbi:hypothetical protein C8R43DRAFT_889589 [Mycena crocata]|nr:hypothetical protein C8R43DRAFT_889589 [Mycena crocata]
MTHEIYWRDHQQWLETCGYMLRPRFRPGWRPSWIAQGCSGSPLLSEDGRYSLSANVIDAIRVKDGLAVVLKKLKRSSPDSATETKIGLYFSTPPQASHPWNHCIPTYEVLHVPDDDEHELVVMPALRRFTSPRFDTVGEVVECWRQIFQGIQFMHAHDVAHRDCTSYNIMMDATRLYPDGFHPKDIERSRNCQGKAAHTTRTKCNPKYYLINFGLAHVYDPANPRLDNAVRGGDKTVPEFQGKGSAQLHDPFPVDIYYLGNMIKREFLEGWYYVEGYSGLEFMQPLVADMTAEDPSKRPTINAVVDRFDEVRRALSAWKLRSRPIPLKESRWATLYHAIPHWYRRIGYILRGIPPVPVP